MSNEAALRYLRPKTHEERMAVWKLLVGVIFAITFAIVASRFVHLAPHPAQPSSHAHVTTH